MHPFTMPALMGRSITPEAEALIARMTTPPTNLRRYLINRLIRTLKDGGVWTLLEFLHVLAAADSQAARLNWKGTSLSPVSLVGGPVFTADRGYAGSGSDYLQTPSQPSSYGGSNYSIGLWTNVCTSGGGAAHIGVSNPAYISLNPGSSSSFAAGGASGGVADSDGTGFRALSRLAGSDFLAQVDATQTTFSTAVGLSQTSPVYFGADDMRVAAAFGGVSLTATQLNIVRTALSDYLTPVGGA